jgi:hypothetical protein
MRYGKIAIMKLQQYEAKLFRQIGQLREENEGLKKISAA